MTDEEILALEASGQICALVEQHVRPSRPPGYPRPYAWEWPSALDLISFLASRSFVFVLSCIPDAEWLAEFNHPMGETYTAAAATAPLAICRAFLLAMNHKDDSND